MPRIGDEQHVWMNGIYEAVCVMIVFPLIVSIGAGGTLHTLKSAKICKFLGDISYPLYITHYPLIYLYTAWVFNNKLPIGFESMLAGFLLVLVSIAVAYASLKLYDEPVREWLKRKVLMK
jgi:peptidoglycan/LPS O-acetylase OafA/YrhL